MAQRTYSRQLHASSIMEDDVTRTQIDSFGKAILTVIARSRSPLWFSFRLRGGDRALLADYGTIHTNGDHEIPHGTFVVHRDRRTVEQAHT